MKYFLFAILCLFSATIYGQDTIPKFDGHKWEALYSLPIPKNWTIERFLIPPSFATQIMYSGVEDIRFAPGWGNIKSEEYWSYSFLWCLDNQPIFTPQVIEKNLKDYYTGLIRINTDSSKYNRESVSVITKFRLAPITLGESMACTGTIQMLDFMTQKEITLNCKVHLKACTEINKTILFFELSPNPFNHNIWLSLDQLWLNFKCKKI